jgi:hypothetical protein
LSIGAATTAPAAASEALRASRRERGVVIGESCGLSRGVASPDGEWRVKSG